MWWLAAAAMAGGTCDAIGLSDVLAVDGPAVVVLGERHGTQPDLGRAARVVRAYATRGPVTVALEAVDGTRQPTLDRYTRGDLDLDALRTALEWDTSWGFSWKAYARVLRAAESGARLVAAGLPLEGAPDDARFPEPPGYIDILRPTMGDHPMPEGQEPRFVRAMAWRDHRIAAQAVAGWDGKGMLVVLTGRGHVEGGLGVTWQARQLTPAPVHGFVLAWGGDPPCYGGDRVWRSWFGG